MKSSFEINKVRRLLKTQGENFTFERCGKNDFGELDPDAPKEVITILGIYHETSSYVTITEAVGTRSQSKPIPMVLALWEDVIKIPLQIDDSLNYKGNNYRLTGVTNVQNGGYAADISLELIL